MKYQWGRKDSFTFATSSEPWGISWQRGEYPVKIYTIDGVLIYQESNGGTNKNKQPVGGTMVLSTSATSMMETIKTPTLFYGSNGAVVNQVGYTKSLWDYYWTSYSRGTDGTDDWSIHEINYHNNYLDEYYSRRLKSIYDPCPHGFRVSSNGTYNRFPKKLWISGSYVGGASWEMYNNESWACGLGRRNPTIASFDNVGVYGFYYSSILFSQDYGYGLVFNGMQGIFPNWYDLSSYGSSVRCIEAV